MSNKNELNRIKKIVLATAKSHGVTKAGIFGSFAKAQQKKNSDIDILIQPPKGMGLGFINLKLELEKKLKKKVDLVTYKSIHPYLKKEILSSEVRVL